MAGVTLGADGFLWCRDLPAPPPGEQGERGAAAGRRELRRVPAPAVEAIDTLSAGDVFHGAFAFAVAAGRAVEAAAELGCAAAALKCARFGGRRGTPSWAEVAPLLSAEWVGGGAGDGTGGAGGARL